MRADGFTYAQIAEVTGITERTAIKYAKDVPANYDIGKAPEASKDRMILAINRRLNDPATPPQYFTPMASLLSDLCGWKREDASRKALRPMSELFTAWRDETESLNRVSRQSQESLNEPGEPPMERANGSDNLSPTPQQS